MKITEQELKEVIKEELVKVLTTLSEVRGLADEALEMLLKSMDVPAKKWRMQGALPDTRLGRIHAGVLRHMRHVLGVKTLENTPKTIAQLEKMVDYVGQGWYNRGLKTGVAPNAIERDNLSLLKQVVADIKALPEKEIAPVIKPSVSSPSSPRPRASTSLRLSLEPPGRPGPIPARRETSVGDFSTQGRIVDDPYSIDRIKFELDRALKAIDETPPAAATPARRIYDPILQSSEEADALRALGGPTSDSGKALSWKGEKYDRASDVFEIPSARETPGQWFRPKPKVSQEVPSQAPSLRYGEEWSVLPGGRTPEEWATLREEEEAQLKLIEEIVRMFKKKK